MRIHERPDWDQTTPPVTDESTYLSRRQWLKLAGIHGVGTVGMLAGCSDATSTQPNAADIGSIDVPEALRDLYPAERNGSYRVKRPTTRLSVAAAFNNFYEFDAVSKTEPAKLVVDWKVRPWEIEIGGMVKRPVTIDVDALSRKMGLEERVYRFRCVEAWSMVIPWTGFPMRKLIEWVEPLGSAKFVRFVSFFDPEAAPGQKNPTYQWPYYEALRMDEAMNELAMFVTGMYGGPLTKQNGAPIRAIVPWKYGYKSPKSIVKIEFTEQQPPTFWNEAEPTEYSFLSNVEPGVPHPRWSQATERVIGRAERIPTLRYNGYAKQVGSLYR